MAKKQVKTDGESVTPAAASAAPTAEDKKAQMEAARVAREAKLANDKFEYVGEPSKKVAPQAQGIVEILKTSGPLSRKDLVAAMEGKITTRQPMGRILTYYQKSLVELGAIQIIAG